MLAGDKKYLAGLHLFEKLCHRVEFFRLGKVGEVAGVKDERGLFRKGVDASDRLPQRGGDVLVGITGKAQVAVADLHKRECRLHHCVFHLAEHARGGDSAPHPPDQSGAHPRHALQHAPAVNSLVTG